MLSKPPYATLVFHVKYKTHSVSEKLSVGCVLENKSQTKSSLTITSSKIQLVGRTSPALLLFFFLWT